MELRHQGRGVFRRSLRISLVAINLSLVFQTATSSPRSVVTQADAPQNKVSLAPDAQIERDIAGAEIHIYRLSLAEGEFVRLVLEARPGDLVLALQDPDGKPLVEVASAIGFINQKRLSFVATQGGDYQLTVRTSRKDAQRGSYRLKSQEWRRAEPKDKSLIAAERLFEEAERLNRRGSGDASRQAIEKYDAALPLWRADGARLPEAYTLFEIGLTLHNLSRFQEAVDRYSQALPILEEIGDERGVAQTLTNLGWSHSGLGQNQRALDYYNRSLEIRRRLNEPRAIAQTLNLVAVALQALGEPGQAIERYLEALPLAEAAGDHAIEAYGLNGLGWLYYQSGELRQGLDCVERALPLWRKIGNLRGEAQSLNVRGIIYCEWGLADDAMKSFESAIEIWRKVGNRYGEAQVINSVGVLYQYLGDYERTRETYLQALAIWQVIGNRDEEASALHNIGTVEESLGEFRRALEYHHKALDMQVAAGNRIGQITPLQGIGVVHSRLGETEQALDYLGRALKLAQETGQRLVEGAVLSSLGSAYEKVGDEQRALDHYHQALTIYDYYTTRLNLARVERKRGNLSEALALTRETINKVETRRTRIADQQLRISLTARSRNAYEAYADILLRLYERAVASNQPSEQYLTGGLEASEKAHARGLLESLAQARAGIRQGADPALLAEQRAIQDRLNARETSRAALLNSKEQEKRLALLEKQIQELEWQLNDVRTRIRTRTPKYADLMQPNPLTAGEIQKLLDEDTVLLEYLLGEERSLLWAVTPTAIKGYVLPARAEIETQIRRMHELLTKPEQTTIEKSNATVQSNPTGEYKNVAATLGRMLLGPVAGQLDKKRLLIVSDGALEYIPFAALPAPEAAEKKSARSSSSRRSAPGPRPLIADHEIVSLPSASVLAVLRRELTDRRPAPKALAVLADPVFSSDDPRVTQARATNGAIPGPPPSGGVNRPVSESDVTRSSREVGLTDFPRLRFSREEADSIASLLQETDLLKALDFTASRATAQSQELGQYRFLHFATHGLLNSRHPDLSGLVLSMMNEQGEPQEGFLRLHEIYNLKLNADLVVLSACQTALGKEVRGEGLIGLTRGFMYAGAPRVVASLWRVDDRATAELMKRFYQGMLKEGLRPAAALRAAQVSMLKEKRWSAPHYWAAFTIQGEWR
jgi:CHAT domain-containing protein/Tfp pilus assembly protein PilF